TASWCAIGRSRLLVLGRRSRPRDLGLQNRLLCYDCRSPFGAVAAASAGRDGRAPADLSTCDHFQMANHQSVGRLSQHTPSGPTSDSGAIRELDLHFGFARGITDPEEVGSVPPWLVSVGF